MRYLYTLILLLAASSLSAQPGRRAKPASDALQDRHIATFTPFGFSVAYDRFNPVAGFDYEYIISQEYGIGVHIPIVVGYTGPEQGYNNGYNHSVLYTAPGIRFHTARRNSSVDFVTGPSLLLGNMHFKPNDDYYYNPGFTRSSYDYGMVGIVADNSLNFYRNHFAFGFDVRVGALMEERNSSRFFFHLGMHFGGIF